MERNKLDLFIDQDQLGNFLGQLKQQRIQPNQSLFEYRYSQKEKNISKKICQKQTMDSQKDENQDLIDLICMQKSFNTQIFKRPQNPTLLDEEIFSPFQSSGALQSSGEAGPRTIQEPNLDNKRGQKKQKQSKQCIYSKNYRDKKKQQFKALQEQNRFLKNKIQDLHLRIRQLQLQNERLKNIPQEKDLTVHQLNREFMKNLSLLGASIQSNIEDKDQKQKVVKKKTKAELQKQFLDTYEEFGISGTKRKNVLNYHINEIFDVLLRDGQKYFCMLCCKNEDDSFKVKMPKYERINMAFFEIMEFQESDQPRIQEYLNFLYPAMKQIKKQCSDMYQNFEKIRKSLDRVHFIWKSTHVKNIDWVIKRMKIENWFEYNKYHKIMRELKSQWLSFIKNDNQMEDETLDYSKGYKKTKFYQIMNGK